MAKTEVFDKNFKKYEQWFEENKYVYLSELKAVSKLIPEKAKGFEIGIGTGLFAQPLGILEGIEPSEQMRKKARKRGLKVIDAVAENLPYHNESKDFALMVTTICFVDDIEKSFQEAKRVLKRKGSLIIGFVDKNSPVGKMYLKNKAKSLFYRKATFWSSEEVISILGKTGLEVTKIVQTVFGKLAKIKNRQKVLPGYGKGSFVVMKAKKV